MLSFGTTVGAGLVDRVAERQVHRGVAPAVLGGDVDLAAELAEELAAFGVHGPFSVCNVRRVGMPCHLSIQLRVGRERFR